MNFPSSIETPDDLLSQVQKLHAEHGGTTPVRKRGGGDFVLHCKLSVAALGKGDTKKLVSRGGVPCVLVE